MFSTLLTLASSMDKLIERIMEKYGLLGVLVAAAIVWGVFYFIRKAMSDGVRPESQQSRSSSQNISDLLSASEQGAVAPEQAVLASLIDQVNEAQRRIYASVPGKGEAMYFDGFLEHTLPNTEPIPPELVDVVNSAGYEEYTEKVEDDLMQCVNERIEVTEITCPSDRPEIVVLRLKREDDPIVVNRAAFEYFRRRYAKITASATASGPVAFYSDDFIHGYLWPAKE